MRSGFSLTYSIFQALLGLFLLLVLVVFSGRNVVAQESNGDKRSEIERQIEQLELDASQLDKHLQNVLDEKRTLASETEALNSEIKRRQLEIRRISLAVQKAGIDIKNKSEGITELSRKIDKNREALAASLLVLYTHDQSNTITILLKNHSLSDFFTSLFYIEKVQADLDLVLDDFKEERALQEQKKVELEEFQKEQQELQSLQEVERRLLAQKRVEKDELLRLTKGKESIFQQMLQSKKRDIATLKTQLFYLEKTGITAEEALRLADLAAKRAGIRTEFLLALLEVETGRQFEGGVITVGTNLGTGSWQADMRPNQRAAFLKITEELGFNPDQMQVSARPCAKAVRDRIGPGKPCGYGWGGAMGPAQFIPTTWLIFKDRVAELTGHNPPNPWDPEDAFTAAAIFLADAGARSQTAAGETRAAKTYLSGRPNCGTSSCNSYARSILSLAGTIGRIL